MRTRAFTLVELLVAIGVVLFMTGLTVSTSMALIESSMKRETEQTLRLLDMAMREWEVTADRRLTWWNQFAPADPADRWGRADVHGDTAEVLIITEMFAQVGRVESVREIIGRLEPRAVHRYVAGETPAWITDPAQQAQLEQRFVGELVFLDAWDTPIYATHPGRPWTPDDGKAVPRNGDGTIETYHEARYGVPQNRRICFVSAGPDGDFGRLYAAPGSAEFEATRDNLYSTAVSSSGEY